MTGVKAGARAAGLDVRKMQITASVCLCEPGGLR